MHIALFFTFGISLLDWQKTGIIDRETKLYESILNNQNIKYTFITYGDIQDKNVENLPPGIKIIPAYEIINYSNNKYLRFLKSFILPFKLRKILKDIDILKTNQLSGSWVPLILKIITNKKLFIRTGYDAYGFSIKETKPKYIQFGYYLLTQIAIIFSDLFSVTSNNDFNNITNRFILTKNVILRPNWVEVPKYTNIDRKYLNRLLSVGRLEIQKNYKSLILSLKGSEFELDIVGEGSLKKELISFAEQHSVKLNLLGRISNNNLIKLYSEYRYFVIASKFEGNPKALLEAMASGCVVLANKISSIEEIITDQENGLMFSAEDQNLIDVLRQFSNKTDILQKLSKNAVASIEKNNSLDKLLEAEVKDYQKLIRN